MEVYQLREFGAADVLERADVPTPEPGPGEVRVEVRATSVNPVDAKIRASGDAMGFSAPMVPGYDVAGVVDAVGAGVTEFEVGDEVYYTPDIDAEGSYAEYHVERSEIVAHKPPHLSFEEAAALPLVACTAWEALVQRAHTGIEDTVLVHGVGGVGQQAVQLAAALGARVFAVASPRTTELAESLGADVVVDYTEEEFTEVVPEHTDEGVSVVLDGVGGDTLADSLEVVEPYAHLVDLIGGQGDVSAAAKSMNATISYTMMTRTADTMGGVARLVERGQLDPVVDSVRPLAEVVEAHEDIEAGGLTGKIVLTV
jgi:NADPH2:quinone reductase